MLLRPNALSFAPALLGFTLPLLAQPATVPNSLFGYRDFAQQAQIDREFLAVPDAKLAGEALKTLTAVPHVAGSKEDYDTAVYVASKFKAAGLETTIVPYKAWLNLPLSVHVEATDSDGKVLMQGPSKEEVSSDPYQDDPRVLPAFNGSSPSGDVTGEVVYANYGRPEDFRSSPTTTSTSTARSSSSATVETFAGKGLHRAAAWRCRRAHLFRPL